MADRRRRSPKPLRRTTGIRPPRKTLLVFCEGARTEPEYLEALRREPSVRETAAVDIRIDTDSAGFTPLGLVRKAIAARAKALAEDGEIDEIWCIFDVEWPKNHPGLIEAKKLADSHGIGIAVSNPCFEVWLVLHFTGQEGWLDNDSARRLRRKHDSRSDKGLDPARYMPHRRVAADRAARLEQRHRRDGTAFPHDNPSSGMYRLIFSVEPARGGSTG
jgi:hypothetical protein